MNFKLKERDKIMCMFCFVRLIQYIVADIVFNLKLQDNRSGVLEPLR